MRTLFSFLSQAQEPLNLDQRIPRHRTYRSARGVINLLSLIRDRLAPGGLLILETPNMNYPGASYHLWGDATHLVGYTPGASKNAPRVARLRGDRSRHENKSPRIPGLHGIREALANFYLHVLFPTQLYVLEGRDSLRARENIFSPYFWVVAKVKSR